MINLPVTNQPNQSFNASIPIGSQNVNLSFYLSYNDIAGYWALDIGSSDTGNMYVSGLPMLTGLNPVQNMLRQQGYLDIGQAYVVPISANAPDHPGPNDWGVNFILVWGP